MRLKCLICALLLISYSDAVKVKTQDGSVYSGVLIAQNDNFLTISVDGKSIQILKTLISEVDGKHFINNQNPEVESAANQITQTTIEKKEVTTQNNSNEKVKIYLKNGTTFEGFFVSENERIIVLNVNGSPVNIFKNVTSIIQRYTPDENSSPKKGTPVQQSTRADSAVVSSQVVANTDRLQSNDKKNDSAISGLQNKGNDTPPQVKAAPAAISDGTSAMVPAINKSNRLQSTAKINGLVKSILPDTMNNKDSSAQKTNASVSNTSNAVADVKVVDKNGDSLSSDKAAITKSPSAVVNDTLNTKITDVKNTRDKESPIQESLLHKSGPDTVKSGKNSSVTGDQNGISNTQTVIGSKPIPPAIVSGSAPRIEQNNEKNIHRDSLTQPDGTTSNKSNATQLISSSSPKVDSVPKRIKRTDGRIEITLKNGASFIGKTISQDERVIRFESDGVIINILKHLIKEIDGVSYVNVSVTANQKDSIGNIKEITKNAVINSDNSKVVDLTRITPATVVPQGFQMRQLIDSLHSVVWEQRSRTSRQFAAIGQWGTEAIPELKKLLSDTTMSKTYAPVWIDSSNVNQLLSPGEESGRALSRMGQPGFSALKSLSADTDPLVRRRAAFGLGELATDESWALLLALLNDPDSGVRATAVTGLRSKKFSTILIAMLKDDEAEVRANAAFMLGKMSEQTAVKSLKPLLYDKRSFVRMNAAEALGMIGSPEAFTYLINALGDINFNVRENAAYALGDAGDSSAVQPLINLLRDKITSVRIAAITALSQIKDPSSIPSLYSIVKDEDKDVRDQAQIALKKLTDIPTLINSLDDKNLITRKNVLYLLWLMTGKDIGMDKKLWLEWYNQKK